MAMLFRQAEPLAVNPYLVLADHGGVGSRRPRILFTIVRPFPSHPFGAICVAIHMDFRPSARAAGRLSLAATLYPASFVLRLVRLDFERQRGLRLHWQRVNEASRNVHGAASPLSDNNRAISSEFLRRMRAMRAACSARSSAFPGESTTRTPTAPDRFAASTLQNFGAWCGGSRPLDGSTMIWRGRRAASAARFSAAA